MDKSFAPVECCAMIWVGEEDDASEVKDVRGIVTMILKAHKLSDRLHVHRIEVLDRDSQMTIDEEKRVVGIRTR